MSNSINSTFQHSTCNPEATTKDAETQTDQASLAEKGVNTELGSQSAKFERELHQLVIPPAYEVYRGRVCKNTHGLIRKYGLNMCRRCFREYADDIGFKKLD